MGSIPIAYRHFWAARDRKGPQEQWGLTQAFERQRLQTLYVILLWHGMWPYGFFGTGGYSVFMRSLFVAVFFWVGSPALAETTTRTFLAQHKDASEDGRRYLLSFLQGLIAGYNWTNVTLKADGQKALFCLNEQGGRELEDPVRLLKNAAGTDRALFDTPVGMALLVNLKRRFPCREKPTVE